MKKHLYLLMVFAAFSGCRQDGHLFQTDNFVVAINGQARISSLKSLHSGAQYLPEGVEAPLLTLRLNGEMSLPVGFEKLDDRYRLSFEGETAIDIVVEEKNTHLVFEIVHIQSDEDPELAIWGPYPTTIKETIGECVGVVRNGDFAIGIQSLNTKTLGGYPESEDDVMPSYNIFAGDDYSDIDEDKMEKELYRGNVAKATDFGSVLQAYCRNRDKDRIIANWGHDKYVAPAYDDGGIMGSKIALFGCPDAQALSTIGKIELEEGLPHPIIDGVWGKESPGATTSYLIISFGEQDLDQAIELTKQAGLRYLYHGGPFQTWGHFKLNERQFPDNWLSMKRCVDRAASEGVLLGVHTLSNFITTNDPYVTPVPDPRLASVGASVLTEQIDPGQATIGILSPDFFNQFKNNNLHTVRIDEELIRYRTVSENEPWALLDCERGAFGSKASAHKKDVVISKLMDHGYKTFLTNIEMQDKVAERIAQMFNETGLRQISFDGLEGCWATGMGQYGRTLFAYKWYENLSNELKGKVINDASNPGHYFWHIYTRMNWGEPWYAGFRESQTQYRLKNQNFYSRNLMPHMLGWFSMKPETSIEDAEWLLARAAGFDAGFALVTSPQIVKMNGYGGDILDAIKEWERARMGQAFSEDQRMLMKSVDNEFHLRVTGDSSWDLFRIYSERFSHQKKIRQPGEPVYSKFEFTNSGEKQPLGFILTATGAQVENITLEIDNHTELIIPVTLNPGESLKYMGGEEVILYNKAWQSLEEIRVEQARLVIGPGEHSLIIDCGFGNGENAEIKVELRMAGPPEPVNIHGSKANN